MSQYQGILTWSLHKNIKYCFLFVYLELGNTILDEINNLVCCCQACIQVCFCCLRSHFLRSCEVTWCKCRKLFAVSGCYVGNILKVRTVCQQFCHISFVDDFFSCSVYKACSL